MSNIIDVIKLHCNDKVDELKTCRKICVATGNELDTVFIRTESSLIFPYWYTQYQKVDEKHWKNLDKVDNLVQDIRNSLETFDTNLDDIRNEDGLVSNELLEDLLRQEFRTR